MQTSTEATPVSKKLFWTGWVLSAVPIFMMLLSAIMKFAKPPSVVQGFERFGYQQNMIPVIAVLELCSIVIYAVPRTAVLGAILVSAYLGGAIATSVRIGDPSWFAPMLLAMFAWAGLYARDIRLRSLLPFRK
jgi:hypothetical protein